VRDDALGGIGGGGGAHVRGEVEQRGVDLVADRRDDRGPRARDQAGELLVREGQQVLERAAAAGDDDDVDLVEIVQLSQRRGDLPHRSVALHRDLADRETHRRPAAAGVDRHVPLRGGLPTADQPDRARQEGQRLLAGGGEQPLGREHPFELLETFGVAGATTRAPGTGLTVRARSTCSQTGTENDMSTSTSRRVMKLSPAPGRRLSWTISPSTLSGDIRATYSPTFTDSWRSG